MEDGKTQNQIEKLMDRHKPTIGRELSHNTANRGCRPKRCRMLSDARAKGLRKASHNISEDLGWIVNCLEQRWSPEQFAHHVGISHETIYPHVYTDKADCGSLYQQLRCQNRSLGRRCPDWSQSQASGSNLSRAKEWVCCNSKDNQQNFEFSGHYHNYPTKGSNLTG